jgi:hypothetical protein
MATTNAARIARHATLHLSAPPERVFPLLCPVREHDWIETWRASIVYSDSGVAEDDCVFVQTEADGAQRVWAVSRYEPRAGIVEFVAFAPGLHVMKLEIALFPEGSGTRSEWRRTLTALAPAGERALEAYTEEAAAAHMRALEAQLDHYLRTGTRLRA